MWIKWKEKPGWFKWARVSQGHIHFLFQEYFLSHTGQALFWVPGIYQYRRHGKSFFSTFCLFFLLRCTQQIRFHSLMSEASGPTGERRAGSIFGEDGSGVGPTLSRAFMGCPWWWCCPRSCFSEFRRWRHIPFPFTLLVTFIHNSISSSYSLMLKANTDGPSSISDLGEIP